MSNRPTDASDRRSSGSGHRRPRPDASTQPHNQLPRISQEEIDQADEHVVLAFQILGLVKDGTLICPSCSTAKPKKVEQKRSKAGRPYWTCHRCGAYGSATKLLRDNGRKLPQAVSELLGRTTVAGAPPRLPAVSVAKPFNAVVDTEVFNTIRRLGDISAAQKYYGRWHISAEAVAEAGSTRIVDVEEAQQQLLQRFGAERLRQCGVITVDRNGNDYWMFNEDYNVLEVHAWVDANVAGIQFRPSDRHLRRVQAHKAWRRRWSGHIGADGQELEPSEAYALARQADPASAGPEHRYVPPFMTLKGAGLDSLIGCGLRRISTLPPGQRIYVVEGFKDLLAARTFGVEAYAIPGVGVMPPEKVCRFFAERRDTLIVTLDGDEAGARGRDNLMEHLARNGVLAERKDDLRPGMDITDLLVEENAHAGCPCPTCSEWRDEHPFEPTTCPCRYCRQKRS